MKKKFFLFFFGLLMISSISARSYDFISMQNTVMRVIDSTLGIFSPFLELIIGDYSTSEFFFAKVLLLILLTVIINQILKKTPLGSEDKKIGLILSLIVSILAIRFISENDLISGILIPYGTLGVAITTVLPFLIFFYFVHHSGVGPAGRRFFWIIYGVILLVLWSSRSQNLSQTSNMIYGLIFLASIILIIFDKKIHSYFGFSDLKRYEKDRNQERIRKLKRKLNELTQDFNDGIISKSEYLREARKIRDMIIALS